MTVNPQITDSITQPNIKVFGDAPSIAMGSLFQATAQALGNAAHNATYAQQQAYVTAQAATTMGIATLYSIDTASTGLAGSALLPENAAVPPQNVALSPAVTVPISDLAAAGVGAADDVAYRMRATMDAFSASLDTIGESVTTELMRILQIAATSACLTAMIANPEKASSYEDVLASIRKIA